MRSLICSRAFDRGADNVIRRKGHRRLGRKLASFYTSQNDHIQEMLKPLSTLSAEGEQTEAEMALKVKIAVNLSLGANVCLAALQLYAAISSGSLALFASCIDAGESTWAVMTMENDGKR